MEIKVYNKKIDVIPADAVYVGRGSAWGNPYVMGKDGDRSMVIHKFIKYAFERLELEPNWLIPLENKSLVCFCAPLACHGDMLVELSRRTSERESSHSNAKEIK
jgi:hypothetical protein